MTRPQYPSTLALLGGLGALCASVLIAAPPSQPPKPSAKATASPEGPSSTPKALPDINKRIATEASDLIKSKKYAEAAKVLDESEADVRTFAEATNMPLWDGAVATALRLIDAKRAALPKKVGAAPPPRLKPDDNRELTTIRNAASATGAQVKAGKLEEAEKALDKAQEQLDSVAASSGLPVWSMPIASTYQAINARRNDLNEKKQALAEKKAAAAPTSNGLPVGTAAPPFYAVSVDGRPFSSSQLKGKYVLVDFWATWCGPCRAEMPHIKEAYDAFKNDKRLAIVSLSIDQQLADVAEFAAKNDMPWSVGFLGARSKVSDNYKVHAIPAILLIGPDGKVLANGLRGAAIRKKLEEVLAKSTSQPARTATKK